MEYLNEDFAKVYDHPTDDKIVILEWGTGFIWLNQGQQAVDAVLESVKKQGKSGLLAYINAEGYEEAFLEWLVEEWYSKAYAAGLTRIAHKMGEELFAQLSAEQVASEDKSGILFRNFYPSLMRR